jgi:hypothetical protein
MSMSRREFLAAGLALHVGSVAIGLEEQSVGAQGRGAVDREAEGHWRHEYVWLAGRERPRGANADPFGIFQVDLDGKQLSHRQIPLSIDGRGGGTHGVKWHDGKLWVAALRLGDAGQCYLSVGSCAFAS